MLCAIGGWQRKSFYSISLATGLGNMALGCGNISVVSFAAWQPTIHVLVVFNNDFVGHWFGFCLSRTNMAVASGL